MSQQHDKIASALESASADWRLATRVRICMWIWSHFCILRRCSGIRHANAIYSTDQIQGIMCLRFKHAVNAFKTKCTHVHLSFTTHSYLIYTHLQVVCHTVPAHLPRVYCSFIACLDFACTCSSNSRTINTTCNSHHLPFVHFVSKACHSRLLRRAIQMQR